MSEHSVGFFIGLIFYSKMDLQFKNEGIKAGVVEKYIDEESNTIGYRFIKKETK